MKQIARRFLRRCNSSSPGSERSPSFNQSRRPHWLRATMLGGGAFGVLAALVPVPARAKGCIVARQSAPTLAGDDPYLLKSEWLISATYRSLRADTHFRGIDVLEDRQRLRNNVVNKQQILDLGATYAVSRRFNVTLAVPILTYGSWSVPVPVDPPGPRQVQSANGFGDISQTGRNWELDTEW